LIEKPRKYMIANVATIDAGIASPGMIVARRFQEHEDDQHDEDAAISNVSRASLIECLTNTDPSQGLELHPRPASVC